MRGQESILLWAKCGTRTGVIHPHEGSGGSMGREIAVRLNWSSIPMRGQEKDKRAPDLRRPVGHPSP